MGRNRFNCRAKFFQSASDAAAWRQSFHIFGHLDTLFKSDLDWQFWHATVVHPIALYGRSLEVRDSWKAHYYIHDAPG